MKNNKLSSFIIYFLILNWIFLLSLIKVVKAQEIIPLLLIPASQELNLSPGQSAVADVKFFNRGNTPVSGLFRVADFLVFNNQGDPVIIDNPSQANPKFSASQWFTLPFDKATIAPYSEVEIQTQINIPQNVKPGGRYAAIYFEPSGLIPQAGQTGQEKGLAISARIASLVYIKIPGNIIEHAYVSNFFTKSFYEYGPAEIETDIVNQGDYHIRPSGTITVTNLFGKAVDQEKLEARNIFPDGSLIYKNTVGSKWMLGRYKVTLAATYATKGSTLMATTYFWVIPWRVSLSVILTLIVILLLFRSLSDRYRVKKIKLEQELKQEQSGIEKLKQKLNKRAD